MNDITTWIMKTVFKEAPTCIECGHQMPEGPAWQMPLTKSLEPVMLTPVEPVIFEVCAKCGSMDVGYRPLHIAESTQPKPKSKRRKHAPLGRDCGLFKEEKGMADSLVVERPEFGPWTRTFIRFEWKVEDAWIGAFWRKSKVTDDPEAQIELLDVWICFLPCVPLHMQFMRGGIRF